MDLFYRGDFKVNEANFKDFGIHAWNLNISHSISAMVDHIEGDRRKDSPYLSITSDLRIAKRHAAFSGNVWEVKVNPQKLINVAKELRDWLVENNFFPSTHEREWAAMESAERESEFLIYKEIPGDWLTKLEE